MERHLQITDNATFELLYFGFIAGGAKANAKNTEVVDSRIRVRQERDVHRAFRRIATPVEGELGYKLQAGGGLLVLEQSLYELMDKYLGACDWATLKAVEVADMFDYWSTAEKVSAT